MVNLSLKSINAVILLDASGNRVLANYYGPDYTSVKEQKAFEKGLFEKTRLSQGEVILYDNQVVLYRVSIDVYFYVVGSPEENELFLLSLLNTFHDAVASLLRYQVEKRTVLDNLDLVALCVDETVDRGVILDTDVDAIVNRVSKPRLDVVDIPLAEQTLTQAYQTARERLTSQLLR